MTNNNAIDLTTWIHECAKQNIVHIAARDEQGWVDRAQVQTNVEIFRVILDAPPEKRHTIFSEGENLRLDRRTQLQFRVVGVNEDQVLQRDGLKIIIEVPDTVSIPKFDEQIYEINADILHLVDDSDEENGGYQSVAANRVAGLDSEKERLSRFLDTGNSDWGLTEPTGILLEGPPGTGKTELVMEVCQEKYGQLPITISGPEVLSKWVGESERQLREAFEETLDSSHRVLYIDEVDAIARTREEANQEYIVQLVSQLLVLLDGVDAKDSGTDSHPLKVIASTNIAQVIDPALRRPGRLGNRPIQVARPSEQERIAILHHYLENIYISKDGRLGPSLEQAVTHTNSTEVLRQLSRQMEGFSGADIEDAVQETVSRVQVTDQKDLTIDFFQRTLQTYFSRPARYRTREFTPDDLADAPAESIEVTQPVVTVDESSSVTPEAIAKRHFATLRDKTQNEHRYVFRQVTSHQLLSEDKRSTRERTASVFHHLDSERLCVYLEDLDTLAEAQNYSRLVQTIVEVINEQLIRWEEDNILLIDENKDVSSVLYYH